MRSWTGEMEVGLHQAGPERCKEVGRRRPYRAIDEDHPGKSL